MRPAQLKGIAGTLRVGRLVLLLMFVVMFALVFMLKLLPSAIWMGLNMGLALEADLLPLLCWYC